MEYSIMWEKLKKYIKTDMELSHLASVGADKKREGAEKHGWLMAEQTAVQVLRRMEDLEREKGITK